MKRALTIAAKDFRYMVFSPMFFVSAGCVALLLSYSYLRTLAQFSQMSMANAAQMGQENAGNIYFSVFMSHISMSNLLFILITPALTMRLLAEERKVRTYDLLLTAPVTATDIALGKFLAAFGGGLVLVAISMMYPLLTRLLAEFSLKQLFIAYSGLALMAGCYMAVGVFASSVTESVVLAVVLGWILNLFLWFVAQGAGFFESGKMVAVMEHLSVGMHFSNFARGVLDMASLVFLLSLISFFVFLTQRVVESSRWR